jgi:hypothetical protein
MKTIFFLMFILMSLASYCQLEKKSNSDYKSEYEQKIQKFRNVRKTGVNLASAGIAGFCGGAVICAIGINNYEKSGSDLDRSMITGGAFLAIAGGSVLITGIVMSTVGNKIVKKYKKKLELGFLYENKIKGFKIACNF